MPRQREPARLWLRPAREGKSAIWTILDKGKQVGTGCGPGERTEAERKLAEYITAKQPHTSGDSGRPPSAVPIWEVLHTYEKYRTTSRLVTPLARPHELGRRIETMLKFFGDRPASALGQQLSEDYVEHRAPHAQAARRELEDLKAALVYAVKKEILPADLSGRVHLPPAAPARERWLTRSEAARLIWTAWRFRQRERDGAFGRCTRQHIARFILVALYTGTRSAAVCGAAVGPAVGCGYVDLAEGTFYRRAPGSVETNKRQPPVNLPKRLLAHIHRWKRRGISLRSVVEFNGAPVESIKKAFSRCVTDAGLEGKVTPHTLRHTAITWALLNGATTWDASDYFGVSEGLIRRVYGHHCKSRHQAVGEALTGRRRNA